MIRIVPFTKTDADYARYCTLAMDARVMAMIAAGLPMTPEEARVAYDRMLRVNMEQHPLGRFQVLDAQTGTFAGLAKLEHVPDEPGAAEVGYMFAPAFWGRGFGTELVRHMLALARQEDIPTVIGLVKPENIASRRVLEKNGFVFTEQMITQYGPLDQLSRPS